MGPRQAAPWHLILTLAALAGCYESHGRASPEDGGVTGSATDAGPDASAAVDSGADAGARADSGADSGAPVDSGADADAGLACDLSAVQCTALPGCFGPTPSELLYCDDVRICLRSDPGDVMAGAIAEVAERIRCNRADSCDFLCFVEDGGFDDEVRDELCAITRVAPAASIECAIWGP